MAQSYRSLILDNVGSTNREAFALAEAGETGPLWIMARRQTAGRGRGDRPWVSVPGNLHASLLLQLPSRPRPCPALPGGRRRDDRCHPAGDRRRTGRPAPQVAQRRADRAGQVRRHPCRKPRRPRHGATVVHRGIGIDLAWHPADLGRAATDLAEHGCQVSPEAVLGSLSEAMHNWLGLWDCGRGFAGVRQAWLDRAGPAGERVHGGHRPGKD